MNKITELREKINSHQAKLAVIGLGYVGLPVACLFADNGFSVIGVEIKTDRIDQINRGYCPIKGHEPGLPELLSKVVENGSFMATTDYGQLTDVDIILIDVETPIDDNHIPQYVALRNACQSLGKVLKDGALVIVESTVAPGTMKNVVQPIIEESTGKTSGFDFFLGVCPERVMPGKLLMNLQHVSRVCGGDFSEVADVMCLLYGNIVKAELDPCDMVTAELTKTAENAYRDVNIAFANELALICQASGGDFIKVRALVNKSPDRHVLMAGGGVGGHCIPKDPWLLAYGARDKVPLIVIPAARTVNNSMPLHVAAFVEHALSAHNTRLLDAKIAVLGYAYLEESDDTRNSPSEILVSYLINQNAEVIIQDPYVPRYQNEILESINGCDLVIIMVAHQAYRELDLADIKKALRLPILIDARRVISPERATQAGLIYYGMGYPNPQSSDR